MTRINAVESITLDGVMQAPGARLLAADGPHVPLALTDSVTTTTGVVIATYHPVGA
jgi:hypothetical protein